MGATLPPASLRIRLRLDDDPRYRGSVHDDAVARRMGFRAALVPGAFLYGHASRMGVDAWGADWLHHGAMALKFLKPAYTGDEIVIEAGPLAAEAPARAALTVTGPDGPIATGWLGAPDPDPAPDDLDRAAPLPWPDPRPPIALGGMQPGMAGASALSVLTAEEAARSRAAMDERHPLYEDTGFVHPALVMRRAMFDLNGSFRFPGPVVLVACEGRHLSAFRPGVRFATLSRVSAAYEKRGRYYFESAETVLADGAPVARFRRTQIYGSDGSGTA